MKKRLFAIVLVVVMLVAAVVPVSAYSVRQLNTADALNGLGLFQGRGGTAGYALDANLTRAEGMALLIRMIGKDEEVKDKTYDTPFVDVPAWAAGYVGYAYTNQITNGMGADKFGSDVQLADNMFLTLVLRALGYSDAPEKAEFTWDKPYELAKKVGLIESAEADSSFTRGDAVVIFWNALNTKLVGKDITLAQSLIEQGVFTAEQFEAAAEVRKSGKADQEELETDDTDLPRDENDKPTMPDDDDIDREDPPELEEDVFE